MKLAIRHYKMEIAGRETGLAKIAKFFDRTGYYKGMGERLGDSAIATRLELIDGRAKEAAALCSRKPGNAFWQFLNGATTTDALGERIRLLQEIVLQFRENGKEFHDYSFDVRERLASSLNDIAGFIQKSVAPAKKYHAILNFESSTWRFRMPSTVYVVLPEYGAMIALTEFTSTTYLGVMCTSMDICLTNGETPDVDLKQWDGLVKKARSWQARLDPA